MEYQELVPISREEAESVFVQDSPELSCDAILRLTYFDGDWRWVQDKCLALLKQDNNLVKGCAITCLGHLARIHKQIDIQKVMPILEDLLEDEFLASRVEDSLDDINLFVDKCDRPLNLD